MNNYEGESPKKAIIIFMRIVFSELDFLKWHPESTWSHSGDDQIRQVFPQMSSWTACFKFLSPD